MRVCHSPVKMISLALYSIAVGCSISDFGPRQDVFGQYASELVKDVLEALSDMSSKKLRTKAANCLAVMSTLPHVKVGEEQLPSAESKPTK